MKNLDEDLVRGKIVYIVKDILCDENIIINDNDDLVRDLKIDSDDLSYIFVPYITEAFSVDVPNFEWKKVNTIGDTVRLVLSSKSR
jgi:acyl carrier protein